MALHTKKDFAKIAGVELKDLYIYIKRGKVSLTGDYINDTDDVNNLFLERRKSKEKTPSAQKESKIKPAKPIISNSEIEDGLNNENNKEEELEKDRSKWSLTQLEKEKKLADLIKVEADTVHRQLQIDKITGSSIPTDLVKGIISVLSKSFISHFKDGGESLIISISKTKGLTGKETAELRGEFIKIINIASNKSVSHARKDMKVISDNYSEKREVGEHD
jgi:hypothetical protein